MSNAGAFILSVNVGAQDALITAAQDLYSRLAATPAAARTLDTIKQTHLFLLEKTYASSVPIGSQYFKSVNGSPSQDLGSTVVFELGQYGQFISDAVVNIRLSAMGTPYTVTGDAYTDMAAQAAANLSGGDIKYRWTDYPGIRLFKSVQFTNAGTPIHDYTRDDVLMYHNHFVKPTQRTSWERCMGQGETVEMVGYHRRDDILERRTIQVGPQCPKSYQPPLDLWIPLQLFFVDGQPFPSASVIHGQRTITVQLDTVENLVQAINITKTQSNNAVNAANGNIALPPATIYSTEDTPNANVVIEKMDLYVNHLFVSDIIYEAYANTLSYTMIRVNKRQVVRDNLSSKAIKMNGLKYPIETIGFGFREVRNERDFQKWWRFNRANSYTFPMLASERVGGGGNAGIFLNYYYLQEDPVVDNITIDLQGNKLFDRIDPSFFSKYASFPRAGNTNTTVTAARDPGAYLLSFAQNLGYQPTGHFNSSKIREFYFAWETSIASNSNNIEFVACARCIGFLLIDEGAMQLTFTT